MLIHRNLCRMEPFAGAMKEVGQVLKIGRMCQLRPEYVHYRLPLFQMRQCGQARFSLRSGSAFAGFLCGPEQSKLFR